MIRKEYLEIAAILKRVRRPFATTEDEILDEVAHLLADMLAEDNPHFDRQRFLENCGEWSEKKPLIE